MSSHTSTFTCGLVDTLTSAKCIKKTSVGIYINSPSLQNPLQITNKQTCFCLCVNSRFEQSTVHVLPRDMNSRFILSVCAVSDFPHFTGHPAVYLLCSCTLQFVSKRFPKSQNILSCNPTDSPYAKKMVWEIGLCLEPCGLAHHCLCTGMVFKDKWLHVNQIWHAVQRQAPLVPWHSQTENTTSMPGKDVRSE